MNAYAAYRNRLLHFSAQLKPVRRGGVHAEGLRGARCDSVVVVGMGGSGLPGTFLRGLAAAHRLRVPVHTWDGHGLPEVPSSRRPLFLFVSFSGNTEETLSGLKALIARRTRGRAGVVAGGGTLERLARRHRLPLAPFRAPGLTPREGVGYLYSNLLSLLRAAFPSLSAKDLSRTIRPARGERDGSRIAKHLSKKVALIYTDPALAHLGQAWKTLLDETAKQLAFANTYPEMGHNELAALGATRRTVAAVFLVGHPTPPHERRHLKAIRAALAREGVSATTATLEGRTPEERTWNGFLLGHWTALALAKRNGVDPQRTPAIERLKRAI